MSAYTDADDENMDEIFAYMEQEKSKAQVAAVTDGMDQVKIQGQGSFDDIIAQANNMDKAAAAAPSFVPGQSVQVSPPAGDAPGAASTPAADAASTGGPDPTKVAEAIKRELKKIQDTEGGLDLSFTGRVKLFPRLEASVEDLYGKDIFWKKFLGMNLRPFVAETLRLQEKAGVVVEKSANGSSAVAAAATTAPAGGGGGSGATPKLSVGATAWTPSVAAPSFVPGAAPPAAAGVAVGVGGSGMPAPSPIRANAPATHFGADTPQPPPSSDARQIFVKGLNPGSDEGRIEAFFTQFGSVSSVHILRARGTGISRGMANVTFDVQGDAVKALNKSSYYIDDRMVYCEWSKPREPRH